MMECPFLVRCNKTFSLAAVHKRRRDNEVPLVAFRQTGRPGDTIRGSAPQPRNPVWRA